MSAPSDDLKLFALDASRAFGEAVAEALRISLSPHEERPFEDGEHKARPLTNVRGRDVFVIHALHTEPAESANDKLCKLLFFIGALKDAAARRVTAVIPYLAYARKDRQTKPRDPVTTRYVAAMLEAVGADGVLAMDVHNLAAYQNAFRRDTDHLEAVPLFLDHVATRFRGAELAVVSPDIGGVKRANRFADALEAETGGPVARGFMEKQRSAGVVSGEKMAGDVAGRAVIIIDDLISTGTTMVRAARACREQGATAVHALATHGLFVGGAGAGLADPAIESVVVTNTVPPFRLDGTPARAKLVVLDAAPLFAAAIERMHGGGSLVDLIETWRPPHTAGP